MLIYCLSIPLRENWLKLVKEQQIKKNGYWNFIYGTIIPGRVIYKINRTQRGSTVHSKKLIYKTDEIKITYDVNRCIHAAECVKGLNKVFNPEKKPWIQPDKVDAIEIAEIVPRCPTGALHYELTKSDKKEQTPQRNSISITADGPIYLRGDIRIEDARGDLILEDIRVALCRCGDSENKPLCDNSHEKTDFKAPSAFRTDSLNKDGHTEKNGKLIVKLMENGPSIVEGDFLLYSDTVQPKNCTGSMALCRCGGSGNKPFCDGTHKKVGFEG